ncbi:MAG TPA: DUF4142 domain-containing protein [Chitinophagaceae bacterium]|nr:DUF4142 domain-containing protein [Chitinophagaceae bacterium]
MKLLNTLIASAGLCLLAACGGGTGSTDSTDSAKNVNDSTISSMQDSTNAMNNMDSGTHYSSTPLEKADGDFVVDAANGGMTEIAASQLAQNNATTDRLKNYAAMIIQDHTKANDELKKLASAKTLVLPSALSDKSQKKIDDLGKKTGKDFDKAYTNMMLSDHKDAVDMFKKEAGNAKDADLKTWATSTLPALQMHLDSIRAISGKH